MSVRPLAAVVALAVLFVAPAPPALACTCSVPSPCEAYNEAAAVFVGVATHKDEETGRYDFSVEETFKGVSLGSVSIGISMRGTTCETGFRVGGRYLVYAYDDESGGLITGLCTRTCHVSRASDDFAYLRSRAVGTRGGVIAGTVVREAPGAEERPLASHRVELQSGSVRRSTRTNADGSYAFDGLAPGIYFVRADVPARHVTDTRRVKVELTADGCGQASFVVKPDTRVEGRVLDAAGVPAARILVELIPADETGWVPGVESATTDENGRFRFDDLVPGRYVLGVNGNEAPTLAYPHAPVFYPSATDRIGAGVIEVAEGEALEGLELHIAPQLAERVITGIVTWPDGSPAAGVYVSLKDEAFPLAVEGSAARTDASGAFVIRALAGRSYHVWTLANRGYGDHHAEPVAVDAGDGTVAIGIVLSEEGPNCDRCQPRSGR